MSKFYKTAQGEVYGKCGITFGPDPVEVDDAQLKKVSGRLKQTIGARLAADARLVEVDPPAQAEGSNAKGGKADGGKKGANDKK